jgi:hypothetical protein
MTKLNARDERIADAMRKDVPAAPSDLLPGFGPHLRDHARAEVLATRIDWFRLLANFASDIIQTCSSPSLAHFL